jgi:hypothetical protein
MPKTEHHVSANGAPKRHGGGSKKPSIQEVLALFSDLPSRLHRAVETDPAAVLAVVGGASFLAGMVLGTRVGRAVLAAAIPIGLQQLVATKIAPWIRTYVDDRTRAATGKGNGLGAA